MTMRPNHNSLLFLAGFRRPPRSWLWSFKSLWAASWKSLHCSHCTGTTTSTAWFCPAKIWNYFHLTCLQLRWINSSHVPSLSSVLYLVPQTPYLPAICLHTANFLLVSAFLHHLCLCCTLPHRLQDLLLPPCCRCFPEPAPAWLSLSLCVTGKQPQSNCHTCISLTVLSPPYSALKQCAFRFMGPHW